jgi:hypothetical protein
MMNPPSEEYDEQNEPEEEIVQPKERKLKKQ